MTSTGSRRPARASSWRRSSRPVWLRIGLRPFCLQFGGTAFASSLGAGDDRLHVGLGLRTKYSGADATLGLAFTRTGWLYPFFAPLLGWLGVALTGSDTSANALFGSLQRITAEQLGLNPMLIVASNSTGGVMGKMIDAQSIVVAAAATEQIGRRRPHPPLRLSSQPGPGRAGGSVDLRASLLCDLDHSALLNKRGQTDILTMLAGCQGTSESAGESRHGVADERAA